MSKKVDQPYLDAWKGLLKAHTRTINRIEARLAKAGCVPLTSYDVLLELKNADKQKLRMADLAKRVLLSRSGLTRLVDRLEKEGYIKRENCEGDARGTEAVVTDKGLQALAQAWPIYAEGINAEFSAYLNENEAEIIAQALLRVANIKIA